MKVSLITDKLKHLPTKNKPYIFFMHIPKTGGTSVISSLKKNYLFQFFLVDADPSLRAAKKVYEEEYKSFEQCFQLRECVAAYAMESGFKCISGHIPYSQKLFESENNEYLFFTILRDPVQRFISKYLYSFYKQKEHCRNDMQLAKYLASERGQQAGQEYLRYLNDVQNPAKGTKEMFKTAKENLKKFDVIGFLEDMDVFAASFQKKTNIKLRIPHKNRTRDLTERQIFDTQAIEKIKEICKYDIGIYQYARQNFF